MAIEKPVRAEPEQTLLPVLQLQSYLNPAAVQRKPVEYNLIHSSFDLLAILD